MAQQVIIFLQTQTVVQVVLTMIICQTLWSHGSDGSANMHVGQTFVGGMYNQQVIVHLFGKLR